MNARPDSLSGIRRRRDTARHEVKRHRERAAYDRDSAYAILDVAFVAHVGFAVGGPKDLDVDRDLCVWSGVIPITQRRGRPIPADDLVPGATLPPYLSR